MATTKQEMVTFILAHVQGNADPGDIHRYFDSQTEDVVRESYQKLLQGERQKIISADAETQKAKEEAAAQIAETAREFQNLQWLWLTQTPINGYVLTDCAANRQEVTALFDPIRDGERMTSAWLQKILREQPQLMKRLAWTNYESPQDQGQHSQEQEEKTKSIFQNFCRWNNYGFSGANISVVLSEFPNGLIDGHELTAAVLDGRIHLHAASEEEISENTNVLLRAHAIKWRKKSVAELKAQSGEEKLERESIFSRLPEPTKSTGPALPDTITKEKILAALNSGDREAIRIWKTRYGGMDAINSRLQGLN